MGARNTEGGDKGMTSTNKELFACDKCGAKVVLVTERGKGGKLMCCGSDMTPKKMTKMTSAGARQT